MNEFSLINELNERYSLKNFKETAFFPSVKGLGYEHSMSYVRVGDAYKLDNKEIKQGEISGTVIFPKYSKYLDFIDFIEKSNNLRIIYKPIDVEYFSEVDFRGITGVIKKGATIECEITLNCKGLYYTEDSKRFVVEDIKGESRYPLQFGATFNDYSNISIAYNNTGHAESEILAEIYGYIKQPSIELYINGRLKYKVTFDITVELGQTLLYSAKDGDNFLMLEHSDGTQTNVISCMKLENDNFFKIPKGENILKITSETGVLNKVIFRILTAYKGV